MFLIQHKNTDFVSNWGSVYYVVIIS